MFEVKAGSGIGKNSEAYIAGLNSKPASMEFIEPGLASYCHQTLWAQWTSCGQRAIYENTSVRVSCLTKANCDNATEKISCGVSRGYQQSEKRT